MRRYEITYTDHVYAESPKEARKRIWADLDKDLFNRFAEIIEVPEPEEATDVRPK